MAQVPPESRGYGVPTPGPDLPAAPEPRGPTISDAVTIGATPGSPIGTVRPQPGYTFEIVVSGAKEYVAGGTYAWYANYVRSLTHAIDDITTDFGDDLYERMQFDPQVFACMVTLKAGALAQGVKLVAAAGDFESADDPKAAEIRDLCQRALDNLTTPLNEVLWNMMDAIAYGNKVAEALYQYAEAGQDKGKIVLTALKVKPRRAVAFVVDAYMNVVGLLGFIPGQGAPVQVGTIISDVSKVPNLLPREKFAIFSFRPKDGDPRGTSVLRSAYNAWWLKQQTWPEFLKYITQFASPSLIGETAPDAHADPVEDADGNLAGTATITPEQSMLAALQGMKNGTVIVVPSGAKVTPLAIPTSGDVFHKAFHLYDHQITKGILSQTLATEESTHQTRAASTVHQDILGLVIQQLKVSLAAMIRRDIIRPMVTYNYDATTAEKFLPLVSLGDIQTQDLAEVMQGVAALMRSGYFDQSQLPGMDTFFNFPARDLENPTPVLANASPFDVSASSREGDAYDAGETAPTPAPTRAARSVGTRGASREAQRGKGVRR